MSQAKATMENVDTLIGDFEAELEAVGRWWIDNALDKDHGGLIGQVGVDNSPVPEADKGGIYHCRALWFFSQLARWSGRGEYKEAADRLYRYIDEYFWDREHGGVYWSLDYRGRPAEQRKHVYAQAFCLYGVSAYYRLSENDAALNWAMELYRLLETHAYDRENGGYREGFTRAWAELEDRRLSDKEPNVPKTMNTHLHVLEAYTALFDVQRDPAVEASLKRLIDDFYRHIINPRTHHLRVFMDVDWRDLSPFYSYGHDIECSWLLWEALEALDDDRLLNALKPVVIGMAEACLNEGIGEHGEILDRYELEAARYVEERPWWVQAEGVVGFLNAYRLTGDQRFYDAFLKVWSFIKTYQIDREHGEWHMHSLLDALEQRREDHKAGFWKAPYHNGRAMMEVCSRLRRPL